MCNINSFDWKKQIETLVDGVYKILREKDIHGYLRYNGKTSVNKIFNEYQQIHEKVKTNIFQRNSVFSHEF